MATTLAPSKTDKDWRKAALITLVVTLVVLLEYYTTVVSMVEIWLRSDTFTHGFLIFPISAWLIWRKRAELRQRQVQPFYPGLFILAGLGLIWLMGYLAGVVVVQQYSLMAMIPVIVATALGLKVAYVLAFPLAFLMLAVPFGEILLPPLMEFTANFTIFALQLTGIPVYREGLYFTVPSGNWSVVEACSGLRYLIASFTLGSLYAYLTYRSLKRRLIFILLSVVVPILANGLRAYMIVMIGHLSDMRYAVGVDHLIYGWLFFGVVMAIMFWIGTRWREDLDTSVPGESIYTAPTAILLRPIWLAAWGILLATTPWPFYAAYLESQLTLSPVALVAPAPAATWARSEDPISSWQPLFAGSAAAFSQTYAAKGETVNLRIYYYRGQKQKSEMVSSSNVLVSSDDQAWGKINEALITLPRAGGDLELAETQLRSSTQKLLVWRWYWVAGTATANPYEAKWLQAKARLMGGRDEAAVIILSTPFEDNLEAPRKVLTDYVQHMLPAIENSLRHAAQS